MTLRPIPFPDMSKGIAVQHGKPTDTAVLSKFADHVRVSMSKQERAQ